MSFVPSLACIGINRGGGGGGGGKEGRRDRGGEEKGAERGGWGNWGGTPAIRTSFCSFLQLLPATKFQLAETQ